MKLPKMWVHKKSPTNPDKKEQHTSRKSKDELIHRWEKDDWEKQYKDYLIASTK